MQVSLNAQPPRTLQNGCQHMRGAALCFVVPAAARLARVISLWNLAFSAAGQAGPPPRRRATFVAPHKAIVLPQPRPRAGKNRRNTK